LAGRGNRIFGIAPTRQQRADALAHQHVGGPAGGDDRARHLESGNVGCAGRRRIFALPLQHVGPVDAGGGDADQHLILAGYRHRPLFGHQGVGTARHRDADGRHLRWNRETVEDHMRPPGPEILRRTQNRRTELRFLLTD